MINFWDMRKGVALTEIMALAPSCKNDNARFHINDTALSGSSDLTLENTKTTLLNASGSYKESKIADIAEVTENANEISVYYTQEISIACFDLLQWYSLQRRQSRYCAKRVW